MPRSILWANREKTNPAGIADAGTASLEGPASIRSTDRSGFSARRPAKAQPAVPPLKTMSDLRELNILRWGLTRI